MSRCDSGLEDKLIVANLMGILLEEGRYIEQSKHIG